MRWVSYRVLNARTALMGFFSLALLLNVLPATVAHADPSSIRIAIAYDIGGRGDNGINDAVASGIATAMNKFQLSTLAIREVTTLGTESDREDRLTFLANAGYNLIIAVGAGYEAALKVVAPTFPSTQFAIIGSSNVPLINVTNIDYSEVQGAYLAGVVAARLTGSGKVGFVAESSATNSADLRAFTAGATTISKKVVVSPTLLTAAATSASAIKPLVTRMVLSKVDVIYSLWSVSGDVLTTVQSLNTAKHPVQLIGVSPVQYFLHAPNAHTVVAAAFSEDYSRATMDLISAALRGNTISDILDESAGVYGHRYSLSDAGIGFSLYSASAKRAAAAIVSAESRIRAGKVKL